ncbi:2-C-methyl-D-erythritol 4-phosphate cytidylyltransferase [Methylophilus rhizosphaerae]|uniref:2-C-methyl-D-erythritol 4-phosphate cytidylyltransferase n=2 Tax=Methylophilus rhizosphaerae TaxID=492660 RepID=A0A1G9BVB2_9PROT|nr:2-C-methyl-D-erythritol 4-phosphate cytidylyltransferase [Methylophilus rhizosphaerae]
MLECSSMPRYHVLIPCAGHGARMQSGTPKQYLMLNGKPVLRHAIDLFEAMREITSIVVVVAEKDAYWGADLLADCYKSRIAHCGGDTRAASVLNGLRAMVEFVAADDWILVHDAARPGIDRQMVERLINAVSDQESGALLALPLADTLKRADDHTAVTETIPRDKLWQAQTPQMFRYAALQQALSTYLQRHPTDEAQAMEWMGHQPKLVLGDLKNMKITYPHDLTVVAALIQAAQNQNS